MSKTQLTDEPRCKDCGGVLDNPRYGYCGACRHQYGVEERDSGSGFPVKGRDRVSERLRDGFALLDDDDSAGEAEASRA